MADDDDDDVHHLCPDCGTHFSNAETLRKHCVAIHKRGAAEAAAPAPALAAPAEAPSSKRARDDDDGVASENVELAPLLGVLSDAQKDALLLRAVQADGAFYERILEQARAPLTDEAAEARLSTLDGEGVAAAVRWFMTIGVPANALTLLVAASQRCLAALEELVEAEADASSAAPATAAATDRFGNDVEAEDEEEDGGGGDGGATSRERLLAAVEALPPAGAVGGLWLELLARDKGSEPMGIEALIGRMDAAEAEALRLMLEGLHAAATTARAFAAGVLVGPNGETLDRLAEAGARLDEVLRSPPPPSSGKTNRGGGGGGNGKARRMA